MHRPFPYAPVVARLLACLAAAAWAEEAPSHWSFQALHKPDLPAVQNQDWSANPIDRFILARLENAGLAPAPPAGPETLLRRATFDLTGLPPTPQEINAFLADTSPQAYEKLIDRLLDSPHYGEHWGRHWLDVARFVQGAIKIPGIDRIDMAEPYRDYVVRAFNEDKPYDRFLTEQLAGDLLPQPAQPQPYFDQIIAPAFLSIGPWFDECTDPNKLRLDIVDEQMSTLSQAVLGLNFGCARCHDHKFDPIPTRDYYALAGILRSTRITERFSDAWRDGRPRLAQPIATPEQAAANRAIQSAIAALHSQRWRILTAQREQLIGQIAANQSDYDAALAKLPPAKVLAAFEAEDFAGQLNLKSYPIDPGETIGTRTPLEQWVKYSVNVPAEGNYTLEARYAAGEPTPVAVEINGEILARDTLKTPTGGWEKEHLAWTAIGNFPLRKGANSLRLMVDKNHYFPRLDAFQLTAVAIATSDVATPFGRRPEQDVILQAMAAKRWPPSVPETEHFASPETRSELAGVDERIAQLTSQLAPFEMALAVRDEPAPIDLPIHKGGQVYQTTPDPVPRGVPTLVDALVPRPEIPPNASGRLQLAQWLTNPSHPLTARVMANRVWAWHFGRGIVATPGDLGTQGAAPTHPELLDFLAATLIENGWSLKKLHRLILTSNTYRISGEGDPRSAQLDPDDRLYGRFKPRRLEAECIYDAMLTSIGKVPRQPAGQPLNVTKSKDRALYVLTSSRSPVGLGVEIRKMFPLFGYDPSGVPIQVRDTSRTASQALWWLNNPLPKYYADKLAERLLAPPDASDESRMNQLYLLTLGKTPDTKIRTQTLDYLSYCRNGEKLSPAQAWSRVCLGIFSSDAFSELK